MNAFPLCASCHTLLDAGEATRYIRVTCRDCEAEQIAILTILTVNHLADNQARRKCDTEDLFLLRCCSTRRAKRAEGVLDSALFLFLFPYIQYTHVRVPRVQGEKDR